MSRAYLRFFNGAEGTQRLVCPEINPRPGMTETSLVPEIGPAGVPFGELVRWKVENTLMGR